MRRARRITLAAVLLIFGLPVLAVDSYIRREDTYRMDPDVRFANARRWSHSILFRSGRTLNLGDKDHFRWPKTYAYANGLTMMEVFEPERFGKPARWRRVFLGAGDQYVIVAKPFPLFQPPDTTADPAP